MIKVNKQVCDDVQNKIMDLHVYPLIDWRQVMYSQLYVMIWIQIHAENIIRKKNAD